MSIELLLELRRRDDGEIRPLVRLLDHEPGEPFAKRAHPRRVDARVDGDVRVVREHQRHVPPLACDERRQLKHEAWRAHVYELGLKLIDHLHDAREVLALLLAPGEPTGGAEAPRSELASRMLNIGRRGASALSNTRRRAAPGPRPR